MTVPVLDARSYRQILDETLARISVHNPEWTNFNDSDPGVTLLQLFAFIAESVHYRANLIPERNRLKFLELLQVPRVPASAARGVVAIANERGPNETVTLAEGLVLTAGKTPFVTENGLDVLPVEGRLYLKRRLTTGEESDAKRIYDDLYGALDESPQSLDYYETAAVEFGGTAATESVSTAQQSVDNTLWLALLSRKGETPALTRKAIGGKVLTLGLLPAVNVSRVALPPEGSDERSAAGPALSFAISSGATGDTGPLYQRLETAIEGDPSRELSLVELTLPASDALRTWDDLDPIEDGTGDYPPALQGDAQRSRVVAWIAIRPGTTSAGGAGQLDAAATLDLRLRWVGINAVRVNQRARVQGELLGRADGTPDQAFTLVNRPVVADSVQLKIDGVPWTRCDDLLRAAPEVDVQVVTVAPVAAPDDESRGAIRLFEPVSDQARVFALDPASGQVRFGDGLRGARPRGSVIASYAYGGGTAGNVGPLAINASTELPSGLSVKNPVATWGGTEGETVAQAERLVPGTLRHRDRLVTREDWHEIIDRTPGVSIGRREVLPLFHPMLDLDECPGVVTVLVIPALGGTAQPPEPDRNFLDAVCRHIAPRRLLTTEVYVEGPRYVPIAVALGIDVVPGRDIAPVREAVSARLRRFLSPLTGGFEGRGWPLDKAVVDRELLAQATREAGVAGVRDLWLWKVTDTDYVDLDEVPLRGLQLPYLQQISVVAGDPIDLSRGGGVGGVGSADGSTTGGGRRVPVPVIPQEC